MTTGWDKAIARADGPDRFRDLAKLRELTSTCDLSEWEVMAFPEMLQALEKRVQGELTEAQRATVDRACDTHGVVVDDYLLGLKEIPRGRDVAVNVGPKVLRPPTRRRDEP